MNSTRQPPPGIALVMVLKNEERFLRENLQYHRQAGVSRFYLYLDNCTDQSRAIAESFPESRIEKVPDFVLQNYYYFADLQSWCHNQALAHARVDKIDWLLGLDPDEFASAGNTPEFFSSAMGEECARATPEAQQRAHLVPLVQAVPESCDVISLKTVESIPIPLPAGSHFSNQIYFQGRRPLPRRILNPLTGEERLWDDVLGHKAGKCLVRTSSSVQAHGPHSWTTHQNVKFPNRPKKRPLSEVALGHHYHFVFVSPEHWLEKYTKFQDGPDHWYGGKAVEFPKLSWIQSTKALTPEKALDYARGWVFLDEKKAEALLQQGLIIKDETVRDSLKSLLI